MKIAKIVAQIFSILLHPLLMTIYGICLLFLYAKSFFIFDTFIRFLVPISILSFILPLNCLFLLKRFGLVKDYDLTDRRDRLYPFLIAFLCYILLIYYFAQPLIPLWFLSMLIAPLVLLIFAGIISFFWKISLHMMGIGGLIGCVLSICYNVKGINPYVLFIILFILAGCLGTSRLILKRHTPAQVYTGFGLGLVLSYTCVWLGVLYTITRF